MLNVAMTVPVLQILQTSFWLHSTDKGVLEAVLAR